jgi:anti-sigma factor RsiW
MWRPVSEHELQLYVDGRLAPSRLWTVGAYLEAIPREADRIFEYCRQNALLRSLSEAIAADLSPAGEARLRFIVAAHRRARARGQHA